MRTCPMADAFSGCPSFIHTLFSRWVGKNLSPGRDGSGYHRTRCILLNTTSYYIAHNRRRVSFSVRQWLNTFSTDEITDTNVGKYLL